MEDVAQAWNNKYMGFSKTSPDYQSSGEQKDIVLVLDPPYNLQA